MFDPTEYTIELDKYTFASSSIVRNEMAEFSQIGRVIASDPDMDANALTRYFLATSHPLFGVDWLTGTVYLKRSLRQTFDALQPDNSNTNQDVIDVTLEAKTIDNGRKYSTIHALTRLAPPNMGFSEHALTLAAAQLHHLNASTLKHLPKLASFETALVRIRLRSNLVDLYAKIFSDASLDDLDTSRLAKLPLLPPNRIAYKILRVSFRQPDRMLRIDARENLRVSPHEAASIFQLTPIDSRSFLISFDPFANSSTHHSVNIDFCASFDRKRRRTNDCHRLIDNFAFNSSAAVLESLERTCSIRLVRLDHTQEEPIVIDRFSSLQNVMRLGARMQPAYCSRLLNVFYSSNDTNVSIDDKTGLVSLSQPSWSAVAGAYLIYPVLYFQTTHRRVALLNSHNFILNVQYSKK